MLSYLKFLGRCPRLVVGELWRLLIVVGVSIGAFAFSLEFLREGRLVGEQILAVVLFLLVLGLIKVLLSVVYVQLFAWAVRAPHRVPLSLAVIWQIHFADLSLTNLKRGWRAGAGWSTPAQSKEDNMVLRAGSNPSGAMAAPFQLVSRLSGEVKYLEIVRAYLGALRRLYPKAIPLPPNLTSRGGRIYGISILAGGLIVLVSSGSMYGVLAGFLVAVLPSFYFLFLMVLWQPKRLAMIRVLFDESLGPDAARTEITRLGFVAEEEASELILP